MNILKVSFQNTVYLQHIKTAILRLRRWIPVLHPSNNYRPGEMSIPPRSPPPFERSAFSIAHDGQLAGAPLGSENGANMTSEGARPVKDAWSRAIGKSDDLAADQGIRTVISASIAVSRSCCRIRLFSVRMNGELGRLQLDRPTSVSNANPPVDMRWSSGRLCIPLAYVANS